MNTISALQHESIRQSLRLRRTAMALIGAFFHTLLCLLIWKMGFFDTSLIGFITLFLFMWLVHLSFPLFIIFGWNKNFSDPSMTFAEVFWAVTAVLITVYLTNEMRPAVMMFVLLALAFGAFQLSQRQYYWLIAYAFFGYIFILYLLSIFRPLEVVYREEIVAVSSFLIVCITFSMVSFEMASIRRHLQKKTVQLKHLLTNVEMVSITDELTGIKNRRFIFGVLEQQLWMAERQPNYTFGLIMIDIDHFKNINDTYGHSMGDNVLKETSALIEKELRKMDYFARVGGEEFLILMPFSDLEKAKILATRICEKVKSATSKAHLPPITLSIGATQYQASETLEVLLKRVDKALYLAKQKGRNQVIVL